jgi:hypothetical protein
MMEMDYILPFYILRMSSVSTFVKKWTGEMAAPAYSHPPPHHLPASFEIHKETRENNGQLH